MSLNRRSTVILATALVGIVCGTFVDALPPGAPLLERDDIDLLQHSPSSEGELLCAMCEEHLAPAIVRSILSSEKHHDAVSTMEKTLEDILRDTEDHIHQTVFHEQLHSMLWSPQTILQYSALQRVHHRYPHRVEYLERLVDHIVCSCRSHLWETDRIFGRMLERFAVSEYEALRTIGAVGQPQFIRPTAQEIDNGGFSMFSGGEGGEGSKRPPPKKPTQSSGGIFTPGVGGMPEFGGMSTGNEVQGHIEEM